MGQEGWMDVIDTTANVQGKTQYINATEEQ